MMEPPVQSMRRVSDGHLQFELELRSEHPAFAGHFPGTPVLPGVVQIDWVVQLADIHFSLALGSAQKFQVKYSRVIVPGAGSVTLDLRLDRAKDALNFAYATDGRPVSSGRISLPPPA